MGKEWLTYGGKVEARDDAGRGGASIPARQETEEVNEISEEASESFQQIFARYAQTLAKWEAHFPDTSCDPRFFYVYQGEDIPFVSYDDENHNEPQIMRVGMRFVDWPEASEKLGVPMFHKKIWAFTESTENAFLQDPYTKEPFNELNIEISSQWGRNELKVSVVYTPPNSQTVAKNAELSYVFANGQLTINEPSGYNQMTEDHALVLIDVVDSLIPQAPPQLQPRAVEA